MELRHSGVRHDHENRGRAVVVWRDMRLLGRQLDISLVDTGSSENVFHPAHECFTVTGVHLRIVGHALHSGLHGSVHLRTRKSGISVGKRKGRARGNEVDR